MTFYGLSTVATLSATFTVMCVYFFLYSLYRHVYIGLWAAFWLINFLVQITYIISLPQIPTILESTVSLISVLNHLLLIVATSKFLGRKPHNAWYFWGVGIITACNIAIYSNSSFLAITLPPCIFISYIYFWNGWMFIRHLDKHGWGKNIVGIAFIGLGLHISDMPFLISVSWFVPWGFVISGILRFIISVGTMILYLERNSNNLIAQEKQYRLLAENAADTIYIYQLMPTRKIAYISPAITNLTGYNSDEYYDSPELLFSLVHPGDFSLVQKLINDPVAVSSNPLIMRLIRRDHTVAWVEQITVPFLDQNGFCTSYHGVIRDISARKALEQDVARLDRLNTVGQMAANVAHEIRNPMTTVQGYLQFFLKKPDFLKYWTQFNLMISELDRANLIIKEYLSLCQNKSRELKSVQLNEIINDLAPLIKSDANASNKDVHFCLESIPEIYLDEKEIRQLLINLIRNGLEAMKPGGIITIRTCSSNDDKVALTIQDQGSGMPPQILENLGKPFLTTKENGTGLGLAVVYRIANDHQANVQVASDSKGTTFNILFKSK